jgi:transcriptional antiterminator
VATILHERLHLPQPVIAELFNVTTMTVNRAIRQIRPLLHQVNHVIEPIDKRLYSTADLRAFATSAGVTTPPPAS